MEFVKAKEILETINQMDPDNKETIIKALGIAEHIETSSMEFYTKEAEKTRGSELEEFFKFMVSEEEMHLRKVNELKGMLEQGDNSIQKISFDINSAPHPRLMKAGKDEMTALLFALWREKKAADFYSSASEKSSGNVKDFFTELAEFEKGHVALFEEYVESMQNTNELIMG
jgi:rubrerythrin